MDLYSFADGDPLNHFDPDGRLFAGTLNGAGQWGSQLYAGLGNALDAALHAIVNPWNPLAATRHFSGGYEADFRYQRNFDQGSAAFQLGHQLGYAGAEIGFQMGMVAGPMAFGRMASTAASGGGMSAAIARSGGAMSYGITRAAPSTPIVSLQGPTMTGSSGAGQGVTLNINASQPSAGIAREAINPRLNRRLDAWKSYQTGGGTMSMREWVSATQRQYGGVSGGYSSGYAKWDVKNFGRVHRNSNAATGPHDVYAIINRRTGEVLHIGETGRGVMTRFQEHVREFAKKGIDIDVKPLRTVDGKAAAKQLENRYIKHYERALGYKPRYNFNNH